MWILHPLRLHLPPYEYTTYIPRWNDIERVVENVIFWVCLCFWIQLVILSLISHICTHFFINFDKWNLALWLKNRSPFFKAKSALQYSISSSKWSASAFIWDEDSNSKISRDGSSYHFILKQTHSWLSITRILENLNILLGRTNLLVSWAY